MSVQQGTTVSASGSGRVRKTSPSLMKQQGPMRATIPMASLLRQSSASNGSTMRKSKSNSPNLSPTGSCWKNRMSPDHSSGQRSPGSSAYKAKSKSFGLCANNGNFIRRTASLDTIYLKGQWPRDSFYWYCDILQVDKATQTEDWLLDQQQRNKAHRSATATDSNSDGDKLEKMIRHRLQRNNKEGGSSRERTAAFGLIMQPGQFSTVSDYNLISPSTSSQTNTSSCCIGTKTATAASVNIPIKPLARPPMRSSIEGLNQEIEKLVLKTSGSSTTPSLERSEDEKFQQMTPEGHRAPLADLLRATRSVNTQTPAQSCDLTESCNSSGPPSRDSFSPIIADITSSSSEQGESQGSSPDQETGKLGTSPHINKFLAREPPDGCERVNLKFLEDNARRSQIDLNELEYNPIRPCTFQLRPSLGSAFYQLQPQTEPDAMPLVPPEQDML